MKMELGEHPRKFLLRVDQMAKELERVDRPVDSKDIDIVILSGLTPQYDAEVRMLRELIGLAHAGMDRTCFDKLVRAA